jgi:hypothetical protein
MSDAVKAVAAVLAILLALGVMAKTGADNHETDLQIDACIYEGGVPIIVNHMYSHELKACLKENP